MKMATLTFTKNTTRQYIFSNNPENVNPTQTTYTRETILSAGTVYEMDFYHCNYAGKSLRFAVVAKNNGVTNATITVEASNIQSCAGKNSNQPATWMCADIIRKVLANNGAKSIRRNSFYNRLTLKPKQGH